MFINGRSAGCCSIKKYFHPFCYVAVIKEQGAADEAENWRLIPGCFSPYWQLWKFVLISLSRGCNFVGEETHELIFAHIWENRWLNRAMTLCQPAVLFLRVMRSYKRVFWWLSHAFCHRIKNVMQSWRSVNVYMDIKVTDCIILFTLRSYQQQLCKVIISHC